MSLDWQTFKSALGRNASVTYIDEEYSEIPIDSECEFQEALRLSRLNKKSLRIIVYDHKSQPSQKRYLDLPVTSFANPEEKFVFTKMIATSDSPGVKETCCHCKEDEQPEWFTHYMKRFKKQLFHELKLYIHSAIHSIIEKEKKLTAKSDTHDVDCKKGESRYPGITQMKNAKLEKDSPEVIDQREVKLQRKLERLRNSKSERLEKLDNKILKSFNEEWLLKEAKLHSKRKFSRTRKGGSDKNEGCAPLSVSEKKKVCELLGLCREEKSTNRPTPSPMESSSVIFKGRVSKNEGPHHMRCTDDGEETFGSEFICEARMEPFTSDDKSSGISACPKESHGTPGEAQNSVGALIDFEKDVIASSQKKIEENIIEIQKRLHDIDLLGPLTSTESDVNEKRGNGKEEKWKKGCDLLQDLEAKERNLKERVEQEKVLFGVDCLSLNQPLNEACSLKTSEEKGNKKTGDLENITNNVESEHCTDSEMSVIFVSEEEDEDDEEEENFVVIPSKSPSIANSVSDDKVSPERESKTPDEQPEVTKTKGNDDSKKETEQHKEETVDVILCHQNLRSRRSPFAEETFKPKKIKSKSTEYHFNTENLTQPTFVQLSEGVPERKASAFKFTAGEEENPQKHKPDKREDCKEKKIPQAYDALGRVIYAVNSSGRCLPMEHVLKQNEQTTHPKRVPTGVPGAPAGATPGVPPGVPPGLGGGSADRVFWPHQQDRRSDRSKEIPSVSILPNALMNGASNMASMAFNTAKSVINNLQSAFVSEGKTEMRHPSYEAKAFQEFQERRVSSEALVRLCDMGFLNIELNRQLLLLNDNDLVATVEELIRLHQWS